MAEDYRFTSTPNKQQQPGDRLDEAFDNLKKDSSTNTAQIDSVIEKTQPYGLKQKIVAIPNLTQDLQDLIDGIIPVPENPVFKNLTVDSLTFSITSPLLVDRLLTAINQADPLNTSLITDGYLVENYTKTQDLVLAAGGEFTGEILLSSIKFVSDNLYSVTGLALGFSDNDLLATQGYVDYAIEARAYPKDIELNSITLYSQPTTAISGLYMLEGETTAALTTYEYLNANFARKSSNDSLPNDRYGIDIALIPLCSRTSDITSSSGFAVINKNNVTFLYGLGYLLGSPLNYNIVNGAVQPSEANRKPIVYNSGAHEIIYSKKVFLAGGSFIIIMDTSSRLYCMGSNLHGELCLGDTNSRLFLTEITYFKDNLIEVVDVITGVQGVNIVSNTKSLPEVTQITVYFLTSLGHVYACGYGVNGALGNGDLTNTSIPVRCGTLEGITALTVNSGLNVIAYNTTDAWAWGNNISASLGLDDTTIYTTPTRLPFGVDLPDDVDIVLIKSTSRSTTFNGYKQSTIIAFANGDVYGCGDNRYGQLGLGATQDFPLFTKITTFIAPVKQIESSSCSFLILLENGNLYGAGFNLYGQLGLGDLLNKTSFTQITYVNGAITDIVPYITGSNDEQGAKGSLGYMIIANKSYVFCSSQFDCRGLGAEYIANSTISYPLEFQPIGVLSGEYVKGMMGVYGTNSNDSYASAIQCIMLTNNGNVYASVLRKSADSTAWKLERLDF